MTQTRSKRFSRALACYLAIAVATAATCAGAQSTAPSDNSVDEPAPPQPKPFPSTAKRVERPVPGKLADSAFGRAGERQTSDSFGSIVPTARLQSRIANRIQSRLRSRIDRYYDPQANTTSPFAVAGEGVKRQGQQPQR